MRLVDL